MPRPTPLLSLCVPTYNRAELLDVCLSSLLPQTAPWSELVEVVVSDNASTDATSQVLEKWRQRYTFRTTRQQANIGLLGNITFVAASMANGEFVWLLGDDDLLAAGAVTQVVNLLIKLPDIDLIGLNIGYYPFEKRPSATSAEGGIREAPTSQLRRSSIHGIVPFELLLEGPTADFTAMYASVTRRRWWTEEFPQPLGQVSFTAVRDTYPHAFLIARHMPGKMAGALRDPLVCIYAMDATQFSWSKFHPLTVVLHATKLLKLFETNGIPYRILEPYYLYQLNHRGSDLGNLLWDRDTAGGWRAALSFAWLLRRYPLRLFKIFAISCCNSAAPMPLHWPMQRCLDYCIQRAQKNSV